jgi:hypothetical protein
MPRPTDVDTIPDASPPRPRLTVRRLMILVAASAILLMLGLVRYRHVEYRRKAKACVALAELQAEAAGSLRAKARLTPPRHSGQASQHEAMAARFDRRAAHFRRWEAIWRDASEHPWRVGPPPEPPPD